MFRSQLSVLCVSAVKIRKFEFRKGMFKLVVVFLGGLVVCKPVHGVTCFLLNKSSVGVNPATCSSEVQAVLGNVRRFFRAFSES